HGDGTLIRQYRVCAACDKPEPRSLSPAGALQRLHEVQAADGAELLGDVERVQGRPAGRLDIKRQKMNDAPAQWALDARHAAEQLIIVRGASEIQRIALGVESAERVTGEGQDARLSAIPKQSG